MGFSKYSSNADVVYFSADGEEIFKPYQFKMEEIEGLRYRSKVSNIAEVCLHLEICHTYLQQSFFVIQKHFQ